MDKQGIEPDALHGKSLLEIVDNALDDGYTLSSLAEKYKINYNTFKSRVRSAREAYEQKYKKQTTQRPQEAQVSCEHENKNSITLTSKSTRIKTLPQLLSVGEVDLDIWEVEHWVCNKWDGQRTGGDPVALWQVKAWLVRKVPLEIEHTIQPVQIQLGKLSRVEKKKPVGRRALAIPDIQYGYRRSDNNVLDPFHDRKALDVVLQIAQDYWFDNIILLGDVVDLSEFSDKFLTEPGFYRTTQSALLETSWYLGQLRMSSPEAKMEFIEGNHEYRYARALMTHLQSAYGLRPASEIKLVPSYDLERLLDLDAVNVEWVGNYPDGRVWLNKRLQLRHGNISRKDPGHTSSAIVRESNCSVLFGHTHKIEQVFRTIETEDGEVTIFAGSPGCLCRTDHVVPGHKRGQSWQQGFGIVHYDETESFLELKEIKNGKTIYDGKEYVARDRLEDLQNDTGWEF